MTVLLIDIGNTRVKWGLLKDGRLAQCGHRAHRGRADVAAAAVNRAIDAVSVKSAAVSNVAGPRFETRFIDVLTGRCQIKVRFARVGRSKFGVRCGYRDPKRLGVDRWLTVLAAHALSSSGALIVDVGTTITVDAVTPSGTHLGGLIIPGAKLMADALGQRTSDIGNVAVAPAPSLQEREEFLGRSTAQAVNMGSRFALIGAIRVASQHLSRALPSNAPLWVTGGDGKSLLPELNSKAVFREHLVLEGLALFAGRRIDPSAAGKEG